MGALGQRLEDGRSGRRAGGECKCEAGVFECSNGFFEVVPSVNFSTS